MGVERQAGEPRRERLSLVRHAGQHGQPKLAFSWPAELQTVRSWYSLNVSLAAH